MVETVSQSPLCSAPDLLVEPPPELDFLFVLLAFLPAPFWV
jgi:hypothetical protein